MDVYYITDPGLHPLDVLMQLWTLPLMFILLSCFLDRGQLLDVKPTELDDEPDPSGLDEYLKDKYGDPDHGNE